MPQHAPVAVALEQDAVDGAHAVHRERPHGAGQTGPPAPDQYLRLWWGPWSVLLLLSWQA